MAISDLRMEELGKQRDRITARMAKLKTTRDQIDRKILDELERRGTKTIKMDSGYTLTRAQSASTIVDYDGILGELTPAQRKLVLERKVSYTLLSQAIQSGKIKTQVLRRNSTVRQNQAYVVTGGNG